MRTYIHVVDAAQRFRMHSSDTSMFQCRVEYALSLRAYIVHANYPGCMRAASVYVRMRVPTLACKCVRVCLLLLDSTVT